MQRNVAERALACLGCERRIGGRDGLRTIGSLKCRCEMADDLADERKSDDWLERACDAAAGFTIDLLESNALKLFGDES